MKPRAQANRPPKLPLWERALIQFSRSTRFVLFTILCAAISMVTSYLVMRHVASGAPPMVPGISPEVLSHAQLLRAYGNEIVTLSKEYTSRIEVAGPAPRPDDQRWIDQVFRPQLRALRQRMNYQTKAGQPGGPAANVPAFQQLGAALDKLMAMAANPGDQTLRMQALRTVRHAVTVAEDYIATQNANKSLQDPPVPPKFPGLS